MKEEGKRKKEEGRRTTEAGRRHDGGSSSESEPSQRFLVDSERGVNY